MNDLLQLFRSSTGVSTDTRTIEDGNIFFALKGDNFDGNQYAAKALESGASYAIVDDPNVRLDDRYILVNDVLVTLQDLARSYRRELGIPVLGITGSNGKTTTKELLDACLNPTLNAFVTPGNFNNHIGVPLSLLKIKPTHELAVIELGDNHPGEVAMLCGICEPGLGYITNLGKDHIEGFGTYENNKLAKKELFDYLKDTKGHAFVNDLDRDVREIASELNDFTLLSEIIAQMELGSLSGGRYLRYSIGNQEIETNLVGEYNMENIQATYMIGKHFDVPADVITKGIESYQPSNKRSQWVKTERNDVYLDAYNANPTSMILALDTFESIDSGKPKLAILGRMGELGPLSEKEHKAIVDKIKTMRLDTCWFVGSEFHQFNDGSGHFFRDTQTLLTYLQDNNISGYDVFLKGSRSNKLEQCLDYL